LSQHVELPGARDALIEAVKMEAPILPRDVCERAVDRLLVRLHMAGFVVASRAQTTPATNQEPVGAA
jgi:hypothetical protein